MPTTKVIPPKLQFLTDTKLYLALMVFVMFALSRGPVFAETPSAVVAFDHAAAARLNAEPPGSAAVRYWNGVAVEAMVDILPRYSPVQSFIALGYVQGAVYNAAVAIYGGYQPYHSSLGQWPGASLDAAVARATLDVLLHYLPAAKHPALISKYDAFVATLPAGAAKDAGLQLGQAAAAEIIALRQNDGWQANVPYVQPPLGPGVFQPPSGTTALTPWVAEMQPFLIASPSAFRPGPPPMLNSGKWVKDYREVATLGRLDGMTRTPAQTAIARFWIDQPAWQYNTAYTDLALAHGFDGLETARLYALGNMAAADAGIACWDAKYTYNFWRPEPAINPALNGGHTDDNHATKADTTWKPLISTPPHPEYPSGHGCVTSSQAEVFSHVLGTPVINVVIKSRTVPGQSLVARTYRTAGDLTQEIINVRVWSGIHFRFSDEAGVEVGRKVARWALDRYFQPLP